MLVKIPDFDHYLLDTDIWRVYSLYTNQFLLKDKPHGHQTVQLCEKGKKLIIELHRLIYTMFVGEIPNGYIVHHIDGNPKNNNPKNLTILTRSKHAILHNKGKSISIEMRQHLSDINKGKPSPMKGRHHTEETKKKMSNNHWLKGKNAPQELCEKISKGLSTSSKVAARQKPVECLKDGIVIKEYPSIKSVAADGFRSGLVCQCCQGTRKSHKGFEWRYKAIQ